MATPDRLELQIQAAEREPHVVCWGGAAQLINRDGRKLRTARLGPETEAEFEELRRSGDVIYMLGLTTMIRRDAFLRVGGYDPRFNSADDIELLSRLAELGSVRALPAILGYYRIHGNSFTASRSIIQERLFRFIEARNKARLAGGNLELEALHGSARPAAFSGTASRGPFRPLPSILSPCHDRLCGASGSPSARVGNACAAGRSGLHRPTASKKSPDGRPATVTVPCHLDHGAERLPAGAGRMPSASILRTMLVVQAHHSSAIRAVNAGPGFERSLEFALGSHGPL